ncbi:MAG: TonB-dependent siderophore receptor [Aquabacterium sp.]
MRVKGNVEPSGKDAYQATETRIGKGKQEIRDLPQSITVVTQKVMTDRKLDNVKDVLKNTAGITFQAAEGGEEDIKIHGISLQSTGDIFIDGMRDPAFYDRDTFFLDRVELLRGSASMLFGRGSTGGAVNQVTKQPRLVDENQIDATIGSYSARRLIGDFNKRTGENSALRVDVMRNVADNNGAGSRIDKQGLAGSYRWGIDEKDEFTATLYFLQNHNGMNYGLPWIKPTTSSPVADTTIVPTDPSHYYGMGSDFNDGTAYYGMLSHTHRFSSDVELVSKIRYADYTRDQRATLIGLGAANLQPGGQAATLGTFSDNTVLTRRSILKNQNMQTVTAQSDLSAKFKTADLEHYLQAGVDFANEKKQVFNGVTAQQGGYAPTLTNTTIGTPDSGALINESLRTFRPANAYTSNAYGGYAQDMVQVAPMWKVLAGLRFDNLRGGYDQFSVPNIALTPLTTSSYQMNVSQWSNRAAVLFQPTAQWSFHLLRATSFNTSGDTYSLGADNATVPPEEAVNLELGAKFDTADGKLSTRVSIFRNTKLHERNTDPLIPVQVLSGKRHAAGVDFDIVGRITPLWEIFANFSWIPDARVDVSTAATRNADLQGDRPSLTPVSSGTLWTTYLVHPQWRLGAGLNGRSGQQPNRNPGFFADKFVTADAMVEFTAVPDTLLFRLNVSNLTNKRYADQLYPAFYVPGAGRLINLTASYKF